MQLDLQINCNVSELVAALASACPSQNYLEWTWCVNELQLIFLLWKFNSGFQTYFNIHESWIFRNYIQPCVLSSTWTHDEAGASCSKLTSPPTTVLTIVASCANCVCATTNKTYSIVEGQSMSICGVENSSFWGTFSYETQQNPKPSHAEIWREPKTFTAEMWIEP